MAAPAKPQHFDMASPQRFERAQDLAIRRFAQEQKLSKYSIVYKLNRLADFSGAR